MLWQLLLEKKESAIKSHKNLKLYISNGGFYELLEIKFIREIQIRNQCIS